MQKNKLIQKLIFLLIGFTSLTYADSFENNFYNNHGTVGLINTPTARFFDEGVHGITIYDGNPDQKITLVSNPYDWLEASFFYTNVQGLPYPGFEHQDYKDKGFSVKIRLKKEGVFPALAIGLNDFAGTGYYSSEYIVSSYGINNIDFHLGLGWGQLNGDASIKNPLTYIRDSFSRRPFRYTDYNDQGGKFTPGKYFSAQKVSPFFGISYRLKESLFLNFEKDTTEVVDMELFDLEERNGFKYGKIPYPKKKNDFSFGIKYKLNDNFVLGISHERGNYFSFNFSYKNNPESSKKSNVYQKAEINNDDTKYTKLIKNLEENGIGVNKISETSRSLGLELTQFMHSDIAFIEQIIKESASDAGIKKSVKKDIKIADLEAITEIEESFNRRAKTIYERDTSVVFNTYTTARFKPFLASREEFFKGAFLVENDSEVVLMKNLFFNTNLKYSLADNFDDLRYPPLDTYPAQVRSDIKEYLKNIDKGILIGRAQLDYHLTPKKNHHLMLTGGVLEDMFSGYGMEYLFFKQDANYAFGFEAFSVKKRDYDWGFGHLDYKNTIMQANFYYRNYGTIPFDLKISAGEYLAGDVGSTIEFSRSLSSGVRFGAFATFTDVSAEQFGEGSFDKGIFFNIPIYGNFINYTWRPLTKDPGAKLTRRNNLFDLLVRMRPTN